MKNNVEIYVYLNKTLLDEFTEDEALNQLYDATFLPGIRVRLWYAGYSHWLWTTTRWGYG